MQEWIIRYYKQIVKQITGGWVEQMLTFMYYFDNE